MPEVVLDERLAAAHGGHDDDAPLLQQASAPRRSRSRATHLALQLLDAPDLDLVRDAAEGRPDPQHLRVVRRDDADFARTCQCPHV